VGRWGGGSFVLTWPASGTSKEPLLEAFDREANRMVRRHIEMALQQIRKGSEIDEQTKAVE
jgi:hypothetical protein